MGSGQAEYKYSQYLMPRKPNKNTPAASVSHINE